MVETALVFPILMMLLVALADFGRIFSASIVLETAARDAAEIVALEYTRNPPGDPMASPPLTPEQRLASPAPNPGDPAYYDDLNAKGARTACLEARTLPGTDYQPDGTCPTWPVVRVCIHDGVGNNKCGHPITPGFDASPPAACDSIPEPSSSSWDSSMAGGLGESSRYVEVRVCYKFSPLLPGLPFLPFGDFYLQRTRIFTVACFQDPAVSSC
jgi:hypothetical protein